MPVVTKLKRTRGGAIAVHLDERYWRSVSHDAAHLMNLYEGLELVEEDLAVLEAASEKDRAYDKAVVFLAFRDRSVKEVRDKLERAGFDEDLAESTIARLNEVGLLDDRSFAFEWATSRIAVRGYGRRRLQSELLAKGIEREIVETVLSEACRDVAEEERAYSLAVGRAERLSHLERREALAKLARWLENRGYDAQVAWKAAEQAIQAHLRQIP
ncbi:MAG: regulatory protein RecX [Candidatus Aquicultorales bacterium]